MRVSVVIRTLNEGRHLPELLTGIRRQHYDGVDVEIVVVDSGSTDDTLAIAQQFGCVVTHIRREAFSFGRSLNLGCATATGDILVITSGHCVPIGNDWLRQLCAPVAEGRVDYSYGRQQGGPMSRFSECQIFARYFPDRSRVPQPGFFCNNANAALARKAWEAHRFDEELTGLEDMELAKRLCAAGGKVGYVAEAAVYHYHYESWPQVKRRFEREALALQVILPQIHVSRRDTARYILTSIRHDLATAARQGQLARRLGEIVRYRIAQYLGSYRGNHQHRKLSHAEKDRYFYPSNRAETHESAEIQDRGVVANEGQQ